jgi:hypothetical protein
MFASLFFSCQSLTNHRDNPRFYSYEALKAFVDNSEMLQYIIDLCYFQMIQVDAYEANVPLTTRCEQLRQHDAAWQNFQ